VKINVYIRVFVDRNRIESVAIASFTEEQKNFFQKQTLLAACVTVICVLDELLTSRMMKKESKIKFQLACGRKESNFGYQYRKLDQVTGYGPPCFRKVHTQTLSLTRSQASSPLYSTTLFKGSLRLDLDKPLVLFQV